MITKIKHLPRENIYLDEWTIAVNECINNLEKKVNQIVDLVNKLEKKGKHAQ